MKVNDLRSVLCSDKVLLWIGNSKLRFCSKSEGDNNEYLFWSDDNVSMWDIYGEREIDMIYDGTDGFHIEIV